MNLGQMVEWVNGIKQRGPAVPGSAASAEVQAGINHILLETPELLVKIVKKLAQLEERIGGAPATAVEGTPAPTAAMPSVPVPPGAKTVSNDGTPLTEREIALEAMMEAAPIVRDGAGPQGTLVIPTVPPAQGVAPQVKSAAAPPPRPAPAQAPRAT